MLCLVSDIIRMLILYSWRTFRLLSPVSSGWISIMTVKAYWCHLFHEVYCSCATCRSCMLTVWSLSRCISEEIPVRCSMLGLVAVYYIRVALVLHLMSFWLLCWFPRYTDLYLRSFMVWLTSGLWRSVSSSGESLRRVFLQGRNHLQSR